MPPLKQRDELIGDRIVVAHNRDEAWQAMRDAAFVRRWLAHRAAALALDTATLTIASIRPLSRGVSRETWAIVANDDRGTHEFAVRRDHAAGSVIPTSLRTEFDIYAALGHTAIPHARALWWEDEADWMPDGRPAYLRMMVAGDWRLPQLSENTEAAAAERIELAREHIRHLALVHSVDWRAAGLDTVLPTPPSPREAAEFLVDDLVRQLHSFGATPTVAAAEAIASLRARAPRDLDRLVFCKGTNGHGEEVWRDGRIVAMSDWELAAIGDPAYDFAQCQELVADVVVRGDRVWGMDQALDYYFRLTGRRVTPERVAFYRDAVALLQHVYTQHAARVVRETPTPPIRFVWTATEVAFRNEIRLATGYAGNLLTEAVA
ncbi:phosphotransferase family protein [Nocardia farcinica]|uniref:phosphotransferase family protein n=1 Tax=Nocardia farcinica TaxID=37329 RepID=UPI000A38679C|nr:phosphotransferase family protein [Nocardia farcinica]MBA4857524.1 phosphotransferase family protein [Nocardia farcinica]MBC9816177.1 phosphotransferase family protein [Nocardia farcinica]MBF6072408.1 phosphotransferase family protein [Nocardia farcinica]